MISHKPSAPQEAKFRRMMPLNTNLSLASFNMGRMPKILMMMDGRKLTISKECMNCSKLRDVPEKIIYLVPVKP
jgi:hypothetical protein